MRGFRTFGRIDSRNPVNWNCSLNRGFLAWWLCIPPFFGGNKLRDLCKQYDGTLTNMDPSTDWVGPRGRKGGRGSLDFDATNDFIDFGDQNVWDLSTSESLVLSCWYKPVEAANRNLFGPSLIIAPYYTFKFRVSRLILFIVHDGTDTVTSAADGTAVTNGVWSHLACVIDRPASLMRRYLNGKPNGSTNSISAIDAITMGTKTLLFGHPSIVVDGSADDLRFQKIVGSFDADKHVAGIYRESVLGYPNLLNYSSLILPRSVGVFGFNTSKSMSIAYKGLFNISYTIPIEYVLKFNNLYKVVNEILQGISSQDKISIDVLSSILISSKISAELIGKLDESLSIAIEKLLDVLTLKNISLEELLSIFQDDQTSIEFLFDLSDENRIPIENLLELIDFTKVPIEYLLKVGIDPNIAVENLLEFSDAKKILIEYLSHIPSIKIPIEYLLGLGYPNLFITSGDPPDAEVGVPYSFQYTATGGVPPYVWTIISGTLPGGLTFSTSGLISGTPIETASVTIQVAVTDNVDDRLSIESFRDIENIETTISIETLLSISDLNKISIESLGQLFNLRNLSIETLLNILIPGQLSLEQLQSIIGLSKFIIEELLVMGDINNLPVEFEVDAAFSVLKSLPLEYISKILQNRNLGIEYVATTSSLLDWPIENLQSLAQALKVPTEYLLNIINLSNYPVEFSGSEILTFGQNLPIEFLTQLLKLKNTNIESLAPILDFNKIPTDYLSDISDVQVKFPLSFLLASLGLGKLPIEYLLNLQLNKNQPTESILDLKETINEPMEQLLSVSDLKRVPVEFGGSAVFTVAKFFPVEIIGILQENLAIPSESLSQLFISKNIAIQALLDLQPFNYQILIEKLQSLSPLELVSIEFGGAAINVKVLKWILLNRKTIWKL